MDIEQEEINTTHFEDFIQTYPYIFHNLQSSLDFFVNFIRFGLCISVEFVDIPPAAFQAMIGC